MQRLASIFSLKETVIPSRPQAKPRTSEGSAVGQLERRSERGRCVLKFFAALMAILLLSSDRGSACSHLWRSYTVKGEFVVEVSDKGRLLKGAEVLVFRKLDPPYVLKHVETQVSDGGGLASIGRLAPGQYRVFVKHVEITGEQADVNVLSGSAPEQLRIKLSWPLPASLITQAVFGTLYAGHDQAPLFGAALSLAQVFPDRPAIKVRTNMEGQFAFPTVPEGLYVLNVREGEDASAAHGVDGNIFVEVKRDAENHLPALLLTRTSCGLGYQTTKEKTH